ncbi:hypothetical protein [Frigoriglobus tundricola]|uniref:hypothetical protein n=1 Tax=Frigoriglobus tundricola TaxID=2774151 RepID=UPI00148EDD9C|nr:hypothetical protein [Frigoriglobus tundricola]
MCTLHQALAGGKGRGLTNYAEAIERVKAKWADGSRQKRRAEWEAEQKGTVSGGRRGGE